MCLPFHAELEAKFSKGEHTRWTPTFYNLPLLLEQKQAREQKQPWGVVMGSGASKRRTSALAARMNGIKRGGGGNPSTASLSAVAVGDAHLGGEGGGTVM